MVTQEKALKSLWRGECTAYVREYVKNEKTGRSEYSEIQRFTGEPCRLSFSSVNVTSESDDAPVIQQTVKLFISSAVEIPEGSKLEIKQNGITGLYKRSGAPAVYRYHQEIMLIPFEDYA